MISLLKKHKTILFSGGPETRNWLLLINSSTRLSPGIGKARPGRVHKARLAAGTSKCPPSRLRTVQCANKQQGQSKHLMGAAGWYLPTK